MIAWARRAPKGEEVSDGVEGDPAPRPGQPVGRKDDRAGNEKLIEVGGEAARRRLAHGRVRRTSVPAIPLPEACPAGEDATGSSAIVQYRFSRGILSFPPPHASPQRLEGDHEQVIFAF